MSKPGSKFNLRKKRGGDSGLGEDVMKPRCLTWPCDLRQRADALRAHCVLLFIAALLTSLVADVGPQPRAEEGLPAADTTSGSSSGKPVPAPSLQGASAHVQDMCRLDREIADYNAEIANQRRAIADMQRILDASREPGGVVPDINRLKAQGVAGQGIVGAGTSKPQVIRDAIAEYESKANPQNYAGILRLSNNITRERDKLQAERRQALGLGKDAELPKNERDAIEAMAGGRAFYANEIARSKEFIARLEGKIRERNLDRTKIHSAMSSEEVDTYKGLRSSQSCGGAGGRCPPVRGWSLPAGATCTTAAPGAAPHGHPEH